MEELNICRLCLFKKSDTSNKRKIINIFDNNVMKDLADKIHVCTEVKILNEECLPKSVCTKCIQSILQFYEFRSICQYSDSVIRKTFINGYQINNSDVCLLNNTCVNKTEENSINEEDEFDSQIESVSKINVSNKENITNSEYSNININEKTDFNESDYITECEIEQDDSVEALLSPPPSPRSKKNCKTKYSTSENDLCLEYSNEKQKKVRIYKIDDCMKEIIGDNIYTCDICIKQFTSFFEYFDHQETHNGQLVFKCSKCKELQMFNERKKLVEHDSKHKIACKICRLEVLPKSMAAHLLIHTDIHKCTECGMRHTSNASLQKHIKARHIGVKGFVCHICGKQSSCQSSMNRHIAYHSNERPYKCKYCDFCAKSLNIVQVHTSRKHFAEKCVCEICAKLFKSQPSLIQHMKRIHTKRRHICDICGKAFIERYNLNRHIKKHAGQRLHECKVCHKEFFTVRKLKEHMHSHRQGCVNCPNCGKEFFYKKYFNKHLLKCAKFDNGNINN